MGSDAIVIGGGVIGCAIALQLARGGLAVTLVERTRLGAEASTAAAGMLAPQTEAAAPGPFLDLGLQSSRMYPSFVGDLIELSGIDPDYRTEGTICVAPDGRDLDGIMKWAAWQLEAGLPVELLDAGAARSLEPSISDVAGAVYLPWDRQIDNRKLMHSLRIALVRSGVAIREDTEVLDILVARSRARGVRLSDGTSLPGERVIVAAGCWSASLLGPLEIDIRMTPVRGQMLSLNAKHLGIAHVIQSKGCYLVPRANGDLLVGATVEYAGFDKRVTEDGVSQLRRSAVEAIPLLEGCEPADSWAGLRPDTPDHLPVIGKVGIDNLLLAIGHFRNGILLAPITADIISRMVLFEETPVEVRHFDAGRFLAHAS